MNWQARGLTRHDALDSKSASPLRDEVLEAAHASRNLSKYFPSVSDKGLHFIVGKTNPVNFDPQCTNSRFWSSATPIIAGSLAGHHVEGDTNLFYDVLLEERLPKSVRSLHYDPVELPSFSVQLENVTDFKADLRRGLLHGLSGSLHRRGDCGPYIWRGANVTVDCVLRMNGLRVSYDGVTKQRNNSTEFKLDVDVEETTVFMQVTGRLSKFA